MLTAPALAAGRARPQRRTDNLHPGIRLRNYRALAGKVAGKVAGDRWFCLTAGLCLPENGPAS